MVTSNPLIYADISREEGKKGRDKNSINRWRSAREN